jgi:hypothetical protein
MPKRERKSRQLTFNDAAEGERQRDIAIDRVEDSSALFVERALRAVMRIARSKSRFTTDTVWKLLQRREQAHVAEPRAMGAVMRRACSEGFIRSTDEWQLSKRPACHRRPLRVWRSLICETR